MLRVIRDGKVIQSVRYFGDGDSITLEDGTLIQFAIGAHCPAIEGIDYPFGLPKTCGQCGCKISWKADIRGFRHLDGTLEHVSTCGKEECQEGFMNKARALATEHQRYMDSQKPF